MAQSRNDRERPNLVGVHHLFGGIKNMQIYIAVLATGLGNGMVVVLFGFGGANACLICFMCPIWVSSFLRKCLATLVVVSPGKVVRLLW